jgi:type I restriction enzyme S subunit
MAGEELASSESKSWLYNPALPEHWEHRALYSLARWVNGLAFRDIQFGPCGKPVIKIAEIKGGISGQTKFTTRVFGESVHIRAGDLLFTWSGQPETSIDVFWWRGPDGWLNQHSFRVTPIEGIDPTFFFYLLRYLKPNFVGIARNKQTTGLGHVTKRDLENIEAAYPSLPEQRAIAHILGTLDDKIELNRRMNETLEAMARTLFKSWFVDFDPVRAKAEGHDPGLPIEIGDIFPDSFEDSELGENPKGWPVKKLSDLCSTQYGYTASAVDKPIGPKLLRVTDINKRNWINWGDVPYCAIDPDTRASYVLEIGDLVVARMADPGKSAIIEEDIDAVFASYLVRLKTPSLAHSYYVHGFLKSDLYAEYAEGAKSGSVQANMNAKVIVGASLTVPPEQVIQQFLRAVLPLRQRLVANVLESRTLAALRDTLLPKLISGEMRVKDTENSVREVQ